MTLPNERARSIRYAREFLIRLLDPKETPRVPRAIRQQAARVLRHFPGEYDMQQAADNCPNIFEYEEIE